MVKWSPRLSLRASAERTNQIRDYGKIPQLDQIFRDPETSIILGDLAQQQIHAMLGPLEPLGGPNDAHVIPHKTSQFFPVVGNHHFFIIWT
jgi:hypothetical protein